MIEDHDALEILSRGVFRIDEDGSIWRLKTRTRTGRERIVDPRRADRLDNTGYRRVRIGKYGAFLAHRLVWLALRGPIDRGVEINHKNLNKADNRIENLELLTHAGNVQHAFAAGVVPAMRGESNGQHKLTESQVVEIRGLLIAGESRRAIARRFDVSHVAINHIAKGRIWKHAAFPEVR